MTNTHSKARTAKRLITLGLMSGTALIAAPTLVFAQDEETSSSGRRDEIVVTATRREQSVTDVPYNITAVGGDAIEAAKTFDDAELLRSVPGVGVIDRGARNAERNAADP